MALQRMREPTRALVARCLDAHAAEIGALLEALP
jgi:hypothetical protein